MPKIKIKDLSKKEKREVVDEFMFIVLELESKSEIIDFFIGLLTQSEAIMFGRRIKTARLILENKTYDEIMAEIGVGKSTIKNTDEWLNKRGGKYRKVLKKYFRRRTIKEKEFFNLDRYPLYRTVLSILNLR